MFWVFDGLYDFGKVIEFFLSFNVFVCKMEIIIVIFRVVGKIDDTMGESIGSIDGGWYFISIKSGWVYGS